MMKPQHFAFLSVAMVSALIATLVLTHRPQKKEASVWIGHPVYSADPMEYDMAVHQIALTAVFAPLVTQYHAGEFKGIVASSWRTLDEARAWSFEIRPNMFFENGDAITPEAVRKSLTRVAYLQHARKSASGITESLLGIEKLAGASDVFPGIVVEEKSVVLRFSRPMPGLLKQLFFGIYSIAHSNDFDPATGKWYNPRKATASGAYRIVTWTDEQFVLGLREEFPASLRHPRALNTFNFTSKASHRFTSDIAMGANTEPEFKKDFLYLGTNASDIAYVSCNSWNYGFGPCQDINARRYLRWRFYKELAKRGLPYTRSFFPLGVRDVREMPEPTAVEPPPHSKSDRRTVALYKSNIPFSTIPPTLQSLKASFESLGLHVIERAMPLHLLNSPGRPSNPDQYIDAIIRITGILVEDPDADIRFMVNSKEGIRLPDPTGNLKRIVNRAQFSPQEVNDQLWNDAIVWPLNHLSFGLWAKNGSFDLSQVNVSLPPTDLSWIGVGR